jgi:hypothetical protein
VAAIVKLIGAEIAPAAIDGIATADLVYDAGARRRSRQSGRADRPPSNGHAGAARAKSPVGRRPPGPSLRHENGAQATRAAAAPRPPRSIEPERGADGPRTVGFGDHLPAFLARPPRPAAGP